MGHLQQMDNARNTKKIYQAKLNQKQPKGRPKPTWEDELENDVRKMGTVN